MEAKIARIFSMLDTDRDSGVDRYELKGLGDMLQEEWNLPDKAAVP